MSRVIVFTTNKPAQVLESVNTPEYIDRTDVVINPDLSSLQAVDKLYWKKFGNTVVEMTPAEKTAVDTAVATELAQVKTDKANALTIDAIDLARALVKLNLTTGPALKQALKEVI